MDTFNLVVGQRVIAARGYYCESMGPRITEHFDGVLVRIVEDHGYRKGYRADVLCDDGISRETSPELLDAVEPVIALGRFIALRTSSLGVFPGTDYETFEYAKGKRGTVIFPTREECEEAARHKYPDNDFMIFEQTSIAYAQSTTELEAENVSLEEQIKRLDAKLAKKRAFVETNTAAINSRSA